MKAPFDLSSYDGRVDVGNDDETWVRGRDLPTATARKINDAIRERGVATIAAIGSDAVNQAVKGIAVARQMWRDGNKETDLYSVTIFSTVIDPRGNERTRIVLKIFPLRHEAVWRDVP